MSLSRQVADLVGDLFGVRLARKGRVGPLLEADYLERFYREFQIDCIIDVGANEGQYARRARALGYRGLIVSFEPIPELARRLQRKAADDRLWRIEEIALDSSVHDTAFHIMRTSEFSSLQTPSTAATDRFSESNSISRSIPVRTDTLNNIYPRLREEFGFTRPFLKLDTQGNDVEVVRGADRCLDRFVGLQSELAIQAIYAKSPNYQTALDHYQNAGFVLGALVPNNNGHFPELVEIDCIMFNPQRRPNRLNA